MKQVLILNGPNLNLLGRRQPEIYGHKTLEQIIDRVRFDFPRADIHHIQSNFEGELVNAIQEWGYNPDCAGIVLNAGALSHYSLALTDAILAVPAPVIEVHLSNIFSREEQRRHSVVSQACAGIVAGLGEMSYSLAVEAILKMYGDAD